MAQFQTQEQFRLHRSFKADMEHETHPDDYVNPLLMGNSRTRTQKFWGCMAALLKSVSLVATLQIIGIVLNISPMAKK